MLSSYNRYKPAMVIKDGKFYKDDVIVPPEHGNREQIELIKLVNEAIEVGFQPDIQVTKKVCLSFQCCCGQHLEFDNFRELDEEDPNELIAGETDKCHSCGIKYKVFNDKNAGLMLRILK